MKIGLVLGAGGYPGYPFQLVVLDAIERRLGIDLREAELMVGTSVGAMTALLLRAGFSVADLLAIAHDRAPSAAGHHLLHAVLDPPGQLPPSLPSWRPPSPRSTSPVASWRLLGAAGRRRHRVPAAAAALFPRGRASHHVFGQAANSLFEDAAWPDRQTWIVAMRARDGHRTVFGRDTIPTRVGDAVTASSAIPGWFSPVDVDGVQHVDAGVRSTTHADLAAEHGDLDLTIVVPPLATDEPRKVMLDTPLRWLVNAQLRSEVSLLEAAGMPTVVARPSADVARSMQGDPIHMSAERVRRVLDATSAWADAWAEQHLEAPVVVAPRRRRAVVVRQAVATA